MPKKRKSVTKKSSNLSGSIERTIAKNLVELQKVHINLAEKFDSLAKEISSMLALFELTARNFIKKAPIGEYEKDKEFLSKIDRLLDQNKVLAKGLTLMENRLRDRMYGGNSEETQQRKINTNDNKIYHSSPTNPNRPLPRF